MADTKLSAITNVLTTPSSSDLIYVVRSGTSYQMTQGNFVSQVQPLDAELTALAGLTSAANKLPYFTGSGTASLADLSAFGRSIIDDADEATFKATVNLEIGVDVQAYDADLATIAGLTATTDNFIVSVSNAWASRTPTQVRTTLGLVVGTNVLAYDAGVQQIADLADPNADRILFWDDSESAYAYLTPSNGIGISGTTLQLTTAAKARAYRATNQSINNASFTKVILDTESFDTGNNFDNATNYRYTVPTTGYYLVNAYTTLSSTAAGKRLIAAIYKNGSQIHQYQASTSTGGDTSAGISDIMSLAANDYLEFWVYQDTGGALNLVGGENNTYLSVHPLSV